MVWMVADLLRADKSRADAGGGVNVMVFGFALLYVFIGKLVEDDIPLFPTHLVVFVPLGYPKRVFRAQKSKMKKAANRSPFSFYARSFNLSWYL